MEWNITITINSMQSESSSGLQVLFTFSHQRKAFNHLSNPSVSDNLLYLGRLGTHRPFLPPEAGISVETDLIVDLPMNLGMDVPQIFWGTVSSLLLIGIGVRSCSPVRVTESRQDTRISRLGVSGRGVDSSSSVWWGSSGTFLLQLGRGFHAVNTWHIIHWVTATPISIIAISTSRMSS